MADQPGLTPARSEPQKPVRWEPYGPHLRHVTIASIPAILAVVARRVVLFSTDSCTFCEHARSLLTKRGVAFEEVNLGPHPELQAELAEVTGLETFPQIIVDGEPLGGLNELRAADTRGTLAAWRVDRSRDGQ
jgi:glutaredoxin 3